MKAKARPVSGLAKAVDLAHRRHAPGKHPATIKYGGKTYKLGGKMERHSKEQRA